MYDKNKYNLSYIVSGIVLTGVATTFGGTKKQNVLFIAVDDLKPILGCYGDKQVKSPNIDRLAEAGTVFLNAHCQQAVCGPSRASLLTGLGPDTTRVWNLHTKIRKALPNVVMLPQYFKQNGYTVIGMGKIFDPRSIDNNMSMDRESWTAYLHPKSQADKTFGYLNPDFVRHIQAKKNELKKLKGWDKALKAIGKRYCDIADVDDADYFDGIMADTAAKEIAKLSKQKKPFFLAVGFKKPHLPFNAPKKYWDMYDRDTIKLAEFTDMPEGAPAFAFQPGWELRNYAGIPAKGRLPEDIQRELIHGYYACTSYIDTQVGKLLDALEKSGTADNTIIVLWGDHGWHLGDHSIWCKHTNYEQATHAPLIFVAPQLNKHGNRSISPVNFLDIYPTLCDLSGLPVPEKLHGKNITAILKDGSASVNNVAFSQYPRYIEKNKQAMGYTLRDKRYRYTEWRRCGSRPAPGGKEVVACEFYDYDKDPLEKRNLVNDKSYAEEVARMQKIMPQLIHKYESTE
jgi:arylsulfatase A-like enzyme